MSFKIVPAVKEQDENTVIIYDLTCNHLQGNFTEEEQEEVIKHSKKISEQISKQISEQISEQTAKGYTTTKKQTRKNKRKYKKTKKSKVAPL